MIDYKLYPKNWKTEIRPAILKRADNKCEFCKVPNHEVILRGFKNDIAVYQDMDGFIFNAENGSPMDGDYLGEIDKCNNGTKIVLTIAHINHCITDNNYNNLRALCQRCHLNLDLDIHKATRKANKLKKQPQLLL